MAEDAPPGAEVAVSQTADTPQTSDSTPPEPPAQTVEVEEVEPPPPETEPADPVTEPADPVTEPTEPVTEPAEPGPDPAEPESGASPPEGAADPGEGEAVAGDDTATPTDADALDESSEGEAVSEPEGVVEELMVQAAAPAAQEDPQVCQGLDSGKTDVEGEHTQIEITAPEGMLIYAYCVKAGSTQQGNGPVYVVLDEPAESVIISHPSGKAISHYSVTYVPVEQPVIDLGIVKSHSGIPDGVVSYDEVFSYTLTVTNHGTEAVTAGFVSDTVPASLTVVDVTVPAGWVDESSGNVVALSGVALEPDASAVIVVDVRVEPAPAMPPSELGDIVNTACVEVEDDMFPGNDCDTDTVPREQPKPPTPPTPPTPPKPPVPAVPPVPPAPPVPPVPPVTTTVTPPVELAATGGEAPTLPAILGLSAMLLGAGLLLRRRRSPGDVFTADE